MLNIAEQLDAILPTALSGRVTQTVGTTVSAVGFPAPVGAIAEIKRDRGQLLRAQVIGFRDSSTILYPLGNSSGVRRGNRVRLARTSRWLRVGNELLGRVLDAEGNAVDGTPAPALRNRAPFDRRPPHPCRRPPIDAPLATGIRAIDGLLTCGRGQRMGIFAASGVGKSVLLGMMARFSSAEVIVIGLIGERGREVGEFLRRDLGPEGLTRSVVVVATSDEPAMLRVNAAATATAIAEYFRDQGKDVLLLVDSLTRVALAQREIGLAAGEPPTTRGYPPSVFAALPKLVERAGQAELGSITAFYNVLVEADDPNEPISDAVRGLLDGHVWLSRTLASRGHYPAIDVLESLSRVMPTVTNEEHRQAAAMVRELLATQRDHEDMISVGAYQPGTNLTVDRAVQMQEAIHDYLTQTADKPSEPNEARDKLLALRARAEQPQDQETE
ncbi:MAG: FliI/YscN family ATPase [Pirellulales bacterium]|nr:FliI/YscN family ATPase [Pirellulales bacterium]